MPELFPFTYYIDDFEMINRVYDPNRTVKSPLGYAEFGGRIHLVTEPPEDQLDLGPVPIQGTDDLLEANRLLHNAGYVFQEHEIIGRFGSSNGTHRRPNRFVATERLPEDEQTLFKKLPGVGGVRFVARDDLLDTASD